MSRGRQKRVITPEMMADVKVLSKEDYCEKHSCGEMFFLNMYYKVVSPKEPEPEKIDIFAGVLEDTDILYARGSAGWFKHIQDRQSNADFACQDILHKIQKDDHTQPEKIALFDLLKEWRITRAKYNDSVEFYNQNRHKIIDLIELTKTVSARKKFLQDRVYKVRTLAKEFGKESI